MFVKILFTCRTNVTFHVKRLTNFHFSQTQEDLVCLFQYFLLFYHKTHLVFLRQTAKLEAHIQN